MQPDTQTPIQPALPSDVYPDQDLPTEDGTLEAQPPRVHPDVREARRSGSVRWLILTAVCVGLLAAGGLLVSARAPAGSQVQEPWIVLRIQHEALNAPHNAALQQEAIDAGDAFLATEEDSPWRQVIESNHRLLVHPDMRE